MEMTESHHLALFLRRLGEQGVDAAPVLRRYKLPADASERTQVPIRSGLLSQALDAIAERAGDPFFGLHAAMEPPRGFYGVLEYLGATSRSIREGLGALHRYAPLLSETTDVRWLEAYGKLIVTFGAPGEAALGRQRAECGLALLLRFGRTFTRARIVPEAVWFAHPRPSAVEPLSDYFGTRALSFGAGGNGMLLSAQVLDLPFETYDPSLAAILETHARQVARPRTPGPFLARVEEQLRESLEQGHGTAAHVARRLHMSTRTLQRRLAASHTSFRRVLDGVRHALARAYLSDPELRGNLAEVSHRLAYAGLPSFVRAYRRWTGVSPGRDARRAADSAR